MPSRFAYSKVVFTPFGKVRPCFSGVQSPTTSAFTVFGRPSPNVQKSGSIRWQLQSPSVFVPYMVQLRHEPGRNFGKYGRCGTGPCHCSQFSSFGTSHFFFMSSRWSMKVYFAGHQMCASVTSPMRPASTHSRKSRIVS